jgi:hypothetical protein
MRPAKKAAEPKPAAAPTKAAPKKAATKAAPTKSAPAKGAPAKQKREIGTPEEIFDKIADLSKGERLTLRLVERIAGNDANVQSFTDELRHVKAKDCKSYIEQVMDRASPGWRNEAFFLAAGNAVFYITGDRKKVAAAMDKYLEHLEMMSKQREDAEGDN